MMDNSNRQKIIRLNKHLWHIDDYFHPKTSNISLLCSISGCFCPLLEDFDIIQIDQTRFYCPKCSKEYIFPKDLRKTVNDVRSILIASNLKNIELLNLDGELIPVSKKKIKDEDNTYWVEAKLSKNKHGEVQLMVLAGSKHINDKVQLFLVPSEERLGFDQNNLHPQEVFTIVEATFKKCSHRISHK